MIPSNFIRYDLVQGESNYPNRPHALAIWKADGLVLQDVRLMQSQMWSVAIMHSKNVIVDGLYIRGESDSGSPARNTDGYDAIDSDHVTFRNQYVRNGDDAIAIKGNSTNILVEDSVLTIHWASRSAAWGNIMERTKRLRISPPEISSSTVHAMSHTRRPGQETASIDPQMAVVAGLDTFATLVSILSYFLTVALCL